MMNPTKFCSPHLDIYNSTYEFPQKTPFIKDKLKDLTPIKFNASLVFLLARACNTRSAKLESQFYHFPSSSYAFYKIKNNLKALI